MIAAAVKRTGMHFGVYYSGGLDWSISDLPPQTTEEEVRTWRPNDPAYAMYAYQHFKDLIDKYGISNIMSFDKLKKVHTLYIDANCLFHPQCF